MLEHLPLAYEAEVVDADEANGSGDGGGGDNKYRMWGSKRGWTGHVWSALYGSPDTAKRLVKGVEEGSEMNG